MPTRQRIVLIAMLLFIVIGSVSARADYDAGYEAYLKSDFKTAYEQLKPEAQKGNPKAQFALGLLYHGGKGVEQNSVRAYVWYSLAEANGHKRSAKIKEELAGKLSPEQIKNAKELIAKHSLEDLENQTDELFDEEFIEDGVFVLYKGDLLTVNLGDGNEITLKGKNKIIGEAMLELKQELKLSSTNNDAPNKFYKMAAKGNVNKDDLIKFRTTIRDNGDDAIRVFFGESYTEGGTMMESTIITYRKNITLDCIKSAIDQVRNSGKLTASQYKIFLGYVGKWATQGRRAFAFPGDIDFSFISNDPKVIQMLKAAFDALILLKTGMNASDIDSVSTAHGKGLPEVYVGWWGKNYGDEQIDKVTKKDKTLFMIDPKTGNQIPVDGPNTILQMAMEKNSSGKMFGVIAKTTYHNIGNTEPGLTLEMIRHFDKDIVKSQVYDSLSEIVKACKYLGRSFDSLEGSGIKIDPKFSTQLDFAKKITQYEKGIRDDGTNAGGKLIQDQLDLIKQYFGGFPADLKEVKGNVEGGVDAKIKLNDSAKQFFDECKRIMWGNGRASLNERVRIIEEKIESARKREASGKDIDSEKTDIRNELSSIDEMIKTEYALLKHDSVDIDSKFESLKNGFNKLYTDFTDEFNVRRITDDELKTLEFIKEWLKNKKGGGRLVALAYMVKAIDESVDKANSILDIIAMDDLLLDELRNEQPTNEYLISIRSKIKSNKTLRKLGLDKDLYSNIKYTGTVGAIQHINSQLNQSIQNSISGRMATTGLKYYNLYGELNAYADAYEKKGWSGVATEIFSRRVPLGGAIEAYYRDKPFTAGWECIKTIFPPLGIPEAIGSVTLTILQESESFYWTNELGYLKDNLFASARFKPVPGSVKTHGDVKSALWHLISVKHNGQTILRNEIREKLIEDDWGVKDTLDNTILKSDPILCSILEIIKKEEVSKKLASYKFWPQYRERKKNLYDWTAKNLITELESRMSAEFIEISGTLPELKERMGGIAKDLDAELEMQEAMDKEDYGDSKNFISAWIWNTFRNWNGSGGNVKDNYSTYLGIVNKYIDAYSDVISSRDSAEKGAGFTDKNITVDTGIRMLTGPYFLRGRPEIDKPVETEWKNKPKEILGETITKLLEIKKTVIKDAKLDSEFDHEIIKDMLFHRTWQQIFSFVYKKHDYIKDKVFYQTEYVETATGDARPVTKTIVRVDPAMKEKALERAKYHDAKYKEFLDKFKEHYGSQLTTVLNVLVQWKADPLGEEIKPVKNSEVKINALEDQFFGSKDLEEDDIEDGKHSIDLFSGKYSLTIKANGFLTEYDEDELFVEVNIPKVNVDHEEIESVEKEVFLKAKEGQFTTTVVDKNTKEGITKAEVKLLPPSADYGENFISVDNNGSCIFKDLPPGDHYKVEARAECYHGPVTKGGIIIDNVNPQNSTSELKVDLSPILSVVNITVKDPEGRGLDAVDVTVNGKNDKTGFSGEVAFNEVLPSIKQEDGYKVTAVKDGYTTVEANLKVLPKDGVTEFNKEIMMIAGGRIEVAVVDEFGKIITGAEVFLNWGTNNSKSEISNSDGIASFDELTINEYWLNASKTGYISPETPYRVNISSGNITPPLLTIKLEEGMKIKVWAMDGGKPVGASGAMISMDGATKTAPQGTAEFSPREGKHTFSVVARGYTEKEVVKDIVPGTTDKNIYIQIWPAVTLTVEIFDEKKNVMIKNASATLLLDGKLIDSDQGEVILFSDLEQKTYTVEVAAEDYSSSSISLPINATLGKNQTQRIYLTELTGSISVSVSGYEGSDPDKKVFISVSGQGGSGSGVGLSGSFTGLKRGNYTVSASAEGYESKPVEVTVTPPDSQSVGVELKREKSDKITEKDETEKIVDELKDLIKEGKLEEAYKIYMEQLSPEEALEVVKLLSDDEIAAITEGGLKKEEQDIEVATEDKDENDLNTDTEELIDDEEKDIVIDDKVTKEDDSKGDETGDYVDVEELEAMDNDSLQNSVEQGKSNLESDDKNYPEEKSGDIVTDHEESSLIGADEELSGDEKKAEEEFKAMKEDEADIVKNELKNVWFAKGSFNMDNYVDRLSRIANSSLPDIFGHVKVKKAPSILALKINSKTGDVDGRGKLQILASFKLFDVFDADFKIINNPYLTGTYESTLIEGKYNDNNGKGIGRVSLFGNLVDKETFDVAPMFSSWSGKVENSEKITGNLTLNFTGKLGEFDETFAADINKYDYKSGGSIDDEIAEIFEREDSSEKDDFTFGGDCNQYEAGLKNGKLIIKGNYYHDELKRFSKMEIIPNSITDATEVRIQTGSIYNYSNTGYLVYSTEQGHLKYIILWPDSTPRLTKTYKTPVIKHRGEITRSYKEGSMRIVNVGSRAAKVAWTTKQGKLDSGWIDRNGKFTKAGSFIIEDFELGSRNAYKVEKEGGNLIIYGTTWHDELEQFTNPTIVSNSIKDAYKYKFEVGGLYNNSNPGYLIYSTESGYLKFMILGTSGDASYGSQKPSSKLTVIHSGTITSSYKKGTMGFEDASSMAAGIYWKTKQGITESGYLKKFKGFSREW